MAKSLECLGRVSLIDEYNRGVRRRLTVAVYPVRDSGRGKGNASRSGDCSSGAYRSRRKNDILWFPIIEKSEILFGQSRCWASFVACDKIYLHEPRRGVKGGEIPVQESERPL